MTVIIGVTVDLTMIDTLQFESVLAIAGFLPAKDVLSLTSISKVLFSLGSKNAQFWNMLNQLHFKNGYDNINAGSANTNGSALVLPHPTAEAAKASYLVNAHCDCLEMVRWHHITNQCHGIAGREGHLACRLGHDLIITGGFDRDPTVYIKRGGSRHWIRAVPPQLPAWVYGATLTPLSDGHRAVRFGGFASGGYQNETNYVTVLHHDGNGSVWWEPMTCTIQDRSQQALTDVIWRQISARAYAATILLFDRFLLVVGGMKESGSTLQPILLDTETWTWYHEDITVPGHNTINGPTPRHGASIVEDTQRGRLVLFGGGSGRDLLRSGQDITDVWELHLNGCQTADQVLTSLPWTWHCIHSDQSILSNMLLSPREKLNLGRCHASFRTGRNSVLLAFGGQLTCNSILGYRLDTETFFRPVVQGPLPQARFTFASVSLVEQGYIVFHGGSCSHNASTTVDDMCVLDLAAGLRRSFEFLPERNEEHVRSFPMVSNEEAAVAHKPRLGSYLSRCRVAQDPLFAQLVEGSRMSNDNRDDENDYHDDEEVAASRITHIPQYETPSNMSATYL